ncbi:hypothetical protein PV11_00604 [Exophiala sideris]|uniref:Uncharacterized protein n=1 Tax=Exophiala sideris TaxID=1016849 RepID=A0A0D1XAF2_9EURO|nr:hypothetical protein PV11_00604 [Exophiala sideris]
MAILREEPPQESVKRPEASVIEISSDSSDSPVAPRRYPARKRRRVTPVRYGDFADQGWFVEKMDRNLAREGRRLLEFGGPIFEEDDEDFIPADEDSIPADEDVVPERASDVVPERAPLKEVTNVGVRRLGTARSRKQERADVIVTSDSEQVRQCGAKR